MTAADGGAENRSRTRGRARRPDGAGSERGGAIAWYLDLHAHSTDASDDAGGTVEGYLKWIAARRRRGDRIDGFVLTEHRHFDPSVRYDEIAGRYDVTVLHGAELETDVGHVLVYGITPGLARRIDFADVEIPHRELLAAVRDEGGAAVPAHAGRPRIGLWDHARAGLVALELVGAIETLNGGSSDEENARARELAEEHRLASVGGSDAHFVSAIGRCLTAFERPVTTVDGLVAELAAGRCRALTAAEARAEAAPAAADGREEGTWSTTTRA